MRVWRRALVVGVSLIVLGASILPGQAQDKGRRLVEIISTKEFLPLPSAPQALFVAGILEGVAFTAYGMSSPDYPRWFECVTSVPLGDLTSDTVAFIKADPGFKEGVPSALAQSLGKRCKKAK